MGSRWLSALLAAGACAAGLFWTWLIAFGTDVGVRADQRIYLAVALRRTPEAAELASHTTRLGDPRTYLLLAACVLAIPLLRRRWVLAASAVVLLAGANLTTQGLQELTFGDRHVPLMPRAYWPSGHTTALASLVLALVIGVPRSMRLPASLVAIVAALAMGWAVIVLSSHLPSDVAAAVFVCGMWAALVLAGLLWREDRFRASGAAAA